MEFDKWLHKQSKLVQILLLAIPFLVNWVVELLVRWSKFLRNTSDITALVVAILCIPFGVIIGWIDAVMVALNDKLLLE